MYSNSNFPKVDGYYWCVHPDKVSEIVKVENEVVFEIGSDELTLLKQLDNFKFQGPIEPPEPPIVLHKELRQKLLDIIFDLETEAVTSKIENKMTEATSFYNVSKYIKRLLQIN